MMKLHFAGKNIEVTPALKALLEEKFTKLEHKFSHISNVYTVLVVEKNDQVAEATVHIDGIEIHATATSEDMYQSIEALAAKLTTQLTKHKEKLIEDHR